MISDEVKMVQRDHSSPSFGESDPNTLRPAGAGQMVDPEAIGEDVAPGRMGHNDAATREGVAAQGVARDIRVDEDVPDTSGLARGAKSPHDSVEDPARGGGSVLQPDSGVFAGQPVTIMEPGGTKSPTVQALESRGAPTDKTATPRKDTSTRPSATAQFHRELANGRYNTSTIASGRFESVIADQVDQATRRSGYVNKRGKERTSNKVIDKIVAGKFDVDDYLSGQKFQQSTLNEVARTTTVNGTYSAKDTERILQKVRSLLPAAQAARAKQPSKQ